MRYLVRNTAKAAATKVGTKLNGKVAQARSSVATCDHCGKPITGARAGKATHHPRCAAAAASGF